MENNSTISEEQLSSMTSLVKEIQAQSEATALQMNNSENPPYVFATVTASFSGGPDGANMQGWITYNDREKIYFSGQGKMDYGFPVAQGVAVPLFVQVLPYQEMLKYPSGTWEAQGSWGSGVLILKAGGKWVTVLPLPTVGAGAFGWKVGGNCTYRKG